MHEVSIRNAGFGGWVEGVKGGGGRLGEGGAFVGSEEVLLDGARVPRCFARYGWFADDGVADGASWRGDPRAGGVDHGASLDGFEDGGGGGGAIFGRGGDEGCGVTDVGHAKFVEAGGAGVAIESAAGAEIEFGDDVVDIVPVEEVGFDVFAIAVAADFAFAGVALEGGHFGEGFVAGALVASEEGERAAAVRARNGGVICGDELAVGWVFVGDGDEVCGVGFGLGEHRDLLAGHFGCEW